MENKCESENVFAIIKYHKRCNCLIGNEIITTNPNGETAIFETAIFCTICKAYWEPKIHYYNWEG